MYEWVDLQRRKEANFLTENSTSDDGAAELPNFAH